MSKRKNVVCTWLMAAAIMSAGCGENNSATQTDTVTHPPLDSALAGKLKSPYTCTPPSKRDLNMQPMVLSNTERQQMSLMFEEKYAFVKNGQYQHFQQVQEPVKEAELTLMKSFTTDDCTTWPALRVYYGLEPSINRFCYIYEPVNLVLAGQSAYYDTFNVVTTTPRHLFMMQNGNFGEVPEVQAMALVDSYMQLTYIRNVGAYEHMQVTTDPHGIVFPFEELDELVEQNYMVLLERLGRVLGENGKKLTLKEVKATYPLEGVIFHCGAKMSNGRWVQNLTMSPTISMPPPTPGIFTGASADMGALCPPSCEKAVYRVLTE